MTKEGLIVRSGTTGPFWVKSVADPFRLCLGLSETWTEGFLARSNLKRKIRENNQSRIW